MSTTGVGRGISPFYCNKDFAEQKTERERALEGELRNPLRPYVIERDA